MFDYSALYAMNVVQEPQCWETCSGGFCCSNNFPDFNFNFMTQEGTDLLYLPREYWWAEQTRKTFNNQQGRAPKAFKLDIGEASIGLVYTRCSLLGRCDEVVDKPLLCQFYPFIPVYSYDGRLSGLETGSVYDVAFEAQGQQSPCPVREKTHYMERFAEAEVAGLFDTYLHFYLRCARILAGLMREGVRNNATLTRLRGKDFWNRWELLHLGGRLFDKDRLARECREEYDAARDHDASFTLKDEGELIDKIRAL